MKHNKKSIAAVLTIILGISLCGCSGSAGTASSSGSEKQPAAEAVKAEGTDGSEGAGGSLDEFNVVASFYPMHILTMNIVKGIDGVSESSMSDPNLGCIHDHTFTTEDLKKVENADIYIENGLDLETFNDKLKSTYPELEIIQAAENVSNIVYDGDEANPHVWTDINNYIEQVECVSAALQKADPDHAAAYADNEKSYIEQLEALMDDYSDKIAEIKGRKVLVLDETLPAFCVFTGLDMLTITTDHEQESLSAGDVKNIIKEMKEDNVKSILVTGDGDKKSAQAIAKETGAAIYELNSCMTGKESEDAYLTDMKENLDTIVTIK